MTEAHPRHSFRELSRFDIDRLSANDFECLREFNDPNTAFIMEVDFHVPRHLEDALAQFPPGPERLQLNETMLSQGQLEFMAENPDLSNPLGAERLILSLYPKTNYVIHSELLRMYLRLGVKVTKIHKGYVFYQDNAIASYINSNVEDRAKEIDEVLRNLIKLVLNSNFGYSIRAVWNDVDVRVARSPAEAEKYLCYPRFAGLVQVDEYVTFFIFKPGAVTIKLNYYFGWSVLERSKLRLYTYFYGPLSDMFVDRRLTLHYVDTDSYILSCALREGESDVFHIIKQNEEFFDLSNLHHDHPCFSMKNKGIAGLLKFEIPESEIWKFCGLCVKMYAVLPYKESLIKKKCKGVTNIARQKFTFQNYVDCIFKKKVQWVSMNLIRSRQQKLYTITLNKIGLSALNLKVYYLDEFGLQSVPFGHSLSMQPQGPMM